MLTAKIIILEAENLNLPTVECIWKKIDLVTADIDPLKFESV